MSVEIQVTCGSQDTQQIWDISELIEQVKLTWALHDEAGSLECSYVNDPNIYLQEGDSVAVKVNGVNLFTGWVFKKTISAHESVKLTCYDAKRYLAFKTVNVTGNETLPQLFSRICEQLKLEYKIVGTSDFIIPTRIHDGVTYSDILETAIGDVFAGTTGSQRFAVRCNGKVLELIECGVQQTDIIIGDENLLTDFQYQSDIEDTYTTFVVEREVATQGQTKDKQLTERQKIEQRTKLTAENPENQKKWGTLQYYEKVDANYSDVQLMNRLNVMKVNKGSKRKTLRLECLGNEKCIPGNMITSIITNLEKEDVARGHFVLITTATHIITKGDYTMSLDIDVI